jgi:hypothetical protein
MPQSDRPVKGETGRSLWFGIPRTEASGIRRAEEPWVSRSWPA